MSGTLFHLVVLWLSLSIYASALSPRASAAPIPSYRPPWQCPASYTFNGKVYPVFESAVRSSTISATGTDTFFCQTSSITCYYYLDTGLLQPGSALPASCGPGLQPNSACAYECPLSNGIAADSFLTAISYNFTSGGSLCYRTDIQMTNK
ncbi:hypothetical protein C8R45DRAFT_202408 [Mycena sanguinolenta]|nr:hypothetical protein C8R45DRAFT_202408 [Mycena sanguinolenta]